MTLLNQANQCFAPVDEMERFIAACREGDDFYVEEVLKNTLEAVRWQGCVYGTRVGTGLHHAIETGQLMVATQLLKAGVDIDIRAEGTRETPLMWAVNSNVLASVKFLVPRGADIDAQDAYLKTPLMHGTRFNNGYMSGSPGSDLPINNAIIKYLLENAARLDIRDSLNETAYEKSIKVFRNDLEAHYKEAEPLFDARMAKRVEGARANDHKNMQHGIREAISTKDKGLVLRKPGTQQ